MKRQIICEKCAKESKRMFPTEIPYPGEHVKFVSGIALHDYRCDGCVEIIEIKKGDKCTAFTIWADYGGQPYYEWETKFLIKK